MPAMQANELPEPPANAATTDGTAMAGPSASGTQRRHDLDALRAFAMLLGIALHAAMSFTPTWMVQDFKPNVRLTWFFSATHGFRMPLFFLVSGFFTMMLYRQRGKDAMLEQRFKRVFIPCILGVVTIVPTVRFVSVWARDLAAQQDARRKSDLIESVKNHDLIRLERELAQHADPNQADPKFGHTALSWAALYGDTEAAKLLLDGGANVKGTSRDGHGALHWAAFLGRPEVAALLLKRGADPAAKGPRDDTPADVTRAPWKLTKAAAGYFKIPLKNENELLAGREACRQLLAKGTANPGSPGTLARARDQIQQGYATVLSWFGSSESWGLDRLRKDYQALLSSDKFSARFSPKGEPVHFILTSQFAHLWFLWFLCWFVVIFAGIVKWSRWIPIPGFPRPLVMSPLRLLWLLPLTMLPQLFMLAPIFGPDPSDGILPQPHVLVFYGIFFYFGAFYFDCDDRHGQFGRWWRLTLPLALLVAFPLGMVTASDIVVSKIVQTVYAWLMVFGLIGLFRRLLTKENRTIRYLSDSAYWLYLAHLPLVILAQAWIRDWDWPAGLKFLLICFGVTALLLLTYQTMVRYTWLGRLLNGPRTGSATRSLVVLPEATVSSTTAAVRNGPRTGSSTQGLVVLPEATVSSTRAAVLIDHVSKSFGDFPAVDDLSLEVPGGSIYGFIGPNGSGKTTTLRMIMRILHPDRGHIRVLGAESLEAANDRVGYLPEERGLYKRMSVRDLLRFYAELKGCRHSQQAIDGWLERLDLSAAANRKIAALSKGMAQKVQFIAAIVAHPDLLLLDEPFSGLDPVNRDVLRQLILELNRAGTTVIFSTHDMAVAEKMCDFIFMIYKGKKVLDGTLASIQATYGQDTVRVQLDGNNLSFAGLPGVVKVIDSGHWQELRIEPATDINRLLAALTARGQVRHFELAHPTLQDIFIRIANPEPAPGNFTEDHMRPPVNTPGAE